MSKEIKYQWHDKDHSIFKKHYAHNYSSHIIGHENYNGHTVKSTAQTCARWMAQVKDEEIEALEQTRNITNSFCLDLQMFVHAVVNGFAKPQYRINSFQCIRKQAYTYAVAKNSKKPIWGDDSYLIKDDDSYHDKK